MLRVLSACFLIACLVAPAYGFAPTERVFDKSTKAAVAKKDKVPSGWAGYIQLGASGALVTNDSVVGQTDGLTFNFGITTSGGVSYAVGPHDWRTRFSLALGFSKTPVITRRLIKSSDELKLDTAYYLRLKPWVGPFVRAGIQTQLLSNWNVQAGPVTYRKKRLDGTTDDALAEVLDLSTAFQPLTLKQSIGAFFRPYRKKVFEVEVRLGLGAHEVFADGAFALEDDSKTPEIEVKELKSYNQVGAELGLYLQGSRYKGKLRYEFHAEVLAPLIADQDASDTRDLLELTNFNIGGKLSFKMLSWLSLDYEFKALLQPQLIEDWQVQNTLLLTFSYGYKTENMKKKPKKKVPCAPKTSEK